MINQTPYGETIYALSSGGLPSGIAVVRLSGPHTRSVVEQIAGSVPPPRQAKLVRFQNREGGVIDTGLCIFFPGPASFTGEDCAEFHLHGGRAVVRAMLELISSFRGTRAAEAGAFTQRSFLNGKMDLTAAEALADLIDAETEAQRLFAIANNSDAHRQLYSGWRRILLEARALLEAELDFSDEGDVPGSVSDRVWTDLAKLLSAIRTHASGYHRAEIVREGLSIVILGAPNSGKSSLLNALAKRDVAIVTDEAGTTRDLLEISLDIAGMKVNLVDTAGIRERAAKVEAIGIERALKRAGEADLILYLQDATNPKSVPLPDMAPILRVGTKADLLANPHHEKWDRLVSTVNGSGLVELLEEIEKLCRPLQESTGEILPFRSRHIEELRTAAECLEAAVESISMDLELRAEDLRRAADALGRICGDIGTEEVLGEIFSSFCIGK
ncbi:tRNA uridine-5-carboxymethylaminomethyl(34) synthesis GTPase MnmE [Nitratireductor luteus]|uniref:tRNA uridine-5-carboxymethylaminomethyl(34) synthesis GTPase MnmE n=1 Tax=Nitratireductor luteus TaxID=2976980 RepID=UPI00223E92E8|nr:tRNA uridine-5-carboxymethylaminomethyl(34) synthesis GTPase MnmE [Nitratireductor luteus]